MMDEIHNIISTLSENYIKILYTDVLYIKEIICYLSTLK